MEQIEEIIVFLNSIEFKSKSGSLIYFYSNKLVATNKFNLITTQIQTTESHIDIVINEDGEEILLF